MRAPDHSLYLKLTLQVFRISTFPGHRVHPVRGVLCEVYIGTAEERAENRMNDPLIDHDKDEDDYDVKPGHLYPGVPALPPNFKKRMHTLEDIEELEKELKEHKGDVETRLKHLEMENNKLLKGGGRVSRPLDHWVFHAVLRLGASSLFSCKCKRYQRFYYY